MRALSRFKAREGTQFRGRAALSPVSGHAALSLVPGRAFKQRRRFLEVGCVEALAEPGVDIGEQTPGRLGPFGLPQLCQAQSGAQFQGVRALLAGDIQRMLKTSLCRAPVWIFLLEQQLFRNQMLL